MCGKMSLVWFGFSIVLELRFESKMFFLRLILLFKKVCGVVGVLSSPNQVVVILDVLNGIWSGSVGSRYEKLFICDNYHVVLCRVFVGSSFPSLAYLWLAFRSVGGVGMKAMSEDHFPPISVRFEALYLVLMFKYTIGILPNSLIELELSGFAQVLILDGKFCGIVAIVVSADDVSIDSFAMAFSSFVIGKKDL
ncbi:hypothetical protein M5K25_026607 [Dendrobium thyrsiflorum]|uniref:Uncharacterized protein n=1 Tax=Dendrobium thyrsiflorum TaxID=117978 RepID=A0ABD0TXT0_DENTH